MLIEAMQKVDGEGISMFEAHADVEIFRIRLGKGALTTPLCGQCAS